MATLLFFVTIGLVVGLFIRLVFRLIQGRAAASSLLGLALTIGSYGLLWLSFYLKSEEEIVPLGTAICFDDWCATVTRVEMLPTRTGVPVTQQALVLHITMSNLARGIAQKPSEPRIHLIDSLGHRWAYSATAQAGLEWRLGKQFPLDERLALHQSLATQLVFVLPKGLKRIRILLEEGPWITLLLLPETKKVFLTQL